MSLDDKTQKIKEQVEFYFSDSNLPNDKFLRSKVASHPDGYVEIELLASFKRMKELGATVENVVAGAETSDLLEVDETKKLVRRKVGLLDQAIVEARTIYAKGFSGDATIDSVRDFFAKHAKVLCVRLRRFPKTKAFKGSVYVEFENAEKAQEVAKMTLEYSGNKLNMMMKADHDAQKQKERQDRTQKLKDEKKQEEEAKKPEVVPGCIVKFGDAFADDAAAAAFNGKEFKQKIGAKWAVVYEKGVYARYPTAEDATKAVKEWTEKKEKIGDKEVTPVVLEGEEEKQYYARDEDAKAASAAAAGGRGGRGGRGGKGGCGGRGGKRGRGGNFGDHSSKKNKKK